ncbi:uncharacterized protein LOC119964797 isoform X3 [Scyliorhinus canicula]|uniref:uncharacterized protein LOC119964797 isoform X3 n=1 Tax=Scyliorhinus canicula TaxID=7830 RepID=UPI0018F32873|nr:uncharacterized protein LOC119964797 isoform X3 [Scyliorhinus canicula]
MEHFEAEINLDVTSEMDTDYNGDLLEKMDDYQFARFVENHCINLQQSLNILDEDCIKQSPDNSLIWEKSFEHSILLDVDDDFNLNFSDVCDSYTIFLSQSSAEDDSLNIIADDIGKIENGYDGSDEDEIQTTEETGYEHNQDIHCSSYSDKPDETKDNLESSFQEDKLQEMAGNTTDEEQEELPFDGNLQNVSEYPTDKNLDLVDHMPTRLVSNQSDHMPVSRMIQTQSFRDKRSTVENSFFQEKVPDSELSTGTEASNHRSENEPNTFLSEDTAGVLVAEHEAKLCSTNELFFNPLNDGRSSIAESLLRYFSEEDLALSSTMYIDSETLPETSFTDSFEETVIKKHIPSVATNDLLINIKEFTMSETDRSRKQELDSIFANEEKMLHDENDSHYRTAQGIMESNYVKGLENSPKITQEQNTETPLSIETILEITQNPMLKMGRTISYNEIKYGRVKQHYTLPDLSKVEPKVKIPKRNASNSYNSNKTIMKKAKPSAGSPESSQAIHKSAADVVGEMLDSTQSSVILARTEVNNEKQEKQSVEANHTPELFQQLQEEFDKLLIKYAEAENTIDQLRFGAKVSAYSDSNKNQMAQSETLSPRCQINNLTGPQQHHAQSGSTSDSAILFSLDSCQSIAEVYKATEGERMAQELNKHIEYFKHQVEDFLKCLNTRSISVEDAQWEFKKLIDGQDKLERSYIANKDEHRSLQQRRYLDKNITAGEFDPDREIEGQIFRIGMQLENIKEKIDDDICNRSSPNNSIIMSSPLSTRESTMDAIIQEGLRIGLVTQDSFQMDVVSEELPEEDIKDTQIEDRYNCIPQKQIPTVSTKTPSTLLENNLHSAANPSDSFMNETLGLRSTSFQRQESLIEFKQQQHSPDNGNTGSEGCKPTTVIKTLDSEQSQTESEEILELQDEVSNLKQKLEESLSKLSYEPPSQEQRYRTKSCHRKKTSSTSKSVEDVKLTTSTLNSLKRRHCTWLRADVDVSDRELNNGMEDPLFSDTPISLYAKQSFIQKPRIAYYKQSYSEGHESNRAWLKDSHKDLYSSTNGLNLHAWRMNSCVLCSKDAPHKISERSPGRRHGLTSNNGISAAAVNKCTEMLASISPLRYDAIEYPLISSASRIYYSPTYEIDKIESPCLPNQFYRTKSFLRSKVNKSTCNPQISHLSTSLDKAIEAANSMKKTTRRMIKILSADLTKAEYYKYLYDF